MSTDYGVYLESKRIPSIQVWNDAIQRAGFDLVISSECTTPEEERAKFLAKRLAKRGRA